VSDIANDLDVEQGNICIVDIETNLIKICQDVNRGD
jgi:hypothetical protein